MCPSGRYPCLDPSSSSAAVSSGGALGFREVFDVIDADHDGKISRDDLKAFYSGFADAPLTEDDICSMISAADADLDGFVAYEEFERVVARRRRNADGVMEEVFRVMDRDGDGKVGFDDLKAYLELAGVPAADEDVRLMILMACGGTGAAEGVCFEALVKILAVDSAKA